MLIEINYAVKGSSLTLPILLEIGNVRLDPFIFSENKPKIVQSEIRCSACAKSRLQY